MLQHIYTCTCTLTHKTSIAFISLSLSLSLFVTHTHTHTYTHTIVQLPMDGDDVASMTEVSEQDSWEIDPLEKEWMLASAQADLQGLQQLIMQESNLVNRKDFIHGYTALHWAAKHGRCDIIAGLMLNGAQVNIKSVCVVIKMLLGF